MTDRFIARRCRVTGRVQGVFYRASAARCAIELGVTGAATNLPDGSVEVLACGSEEAVAKLIEWLWLGPSAAKVANVTVETISLWPEERPQRFTTA